MTDLGVLPDGSESSYARGINESGLVVGTSYSSSSMRAFVWDDVDGMKDLNTMLDSSGEGWTLCVATDINESGQIVGWGVDPSGSIRAFLLTPVPAPSTVVGLISIGFMGALGYVWRRRRRR